MDLNQSLPHFIMGAVAGSGLTLALVSAYVIKMVRESNDIFQEAANICIETLDYCTVVLEKVAEYKRAK